jgi:hypothetical protein
MRVVLLLLLPMMAWGQMLQGTVGGAASGIASTPFTVFMTNASSSGTVGQTTGAFKVAQSFTLAQASHITSVTIKVNRTNTLWTSGTAATDQLTLQIWSDTGASLPSASVAASTTSILCSTLATAATNYTFTLSSVSLAAGKWWIVPVITGRSGPNGTDYLSWSRSGSSVYASGGFSSYSSTTSLWAAESSTVDEVFTVTGVYP